MDDNKIKLLAYVVFPVLGLLILPLRFVYTKYMELKMEIQDLKKEVDTKISEPAVRQILSDNLNPVREDLKEIREDLKENFQRLIDLYRQDKN